MMKPAFYGVRIVNSCFHCNTNLYWYGGRADFKGKLSLLRFSSIEIAIEKLRLSDGTLASQAPASIPWYTSRYVNAASWDFQQAVTFARHLFACQKGIPSAFWHILHHFERCWATSLELRCLGFVTLPCSLGSEGTSRVSTLSKPPVQTPWRALKRLRSMWSWNNFSPTFPRWSATWWSWWTWAAMGISHDLTISQSPKL